MKKKSKKLSFQRPINSTPWILTRQEAIDAVARADDGKRLPSDPELVCKFNAKTGLVEVQKRLKIPAGSFGLIPDRLPYIPTFKKAEKDSHVEPKQDWFDRAHRLVREDEYFVLENENCIVHYNRRINRDCYPGDKYQLAVDKMGNSGLVERSSSLNLRQEEDDAVKVFLAINRAFMRAQGLHVPTGQTIIVYGDVCDTPTISRRQL